MKSVMRPWRTWGVLIIVLSAVTGCWKYKYENDLDVDTIQAVFKAVDDSDVDALKALYAKNPKILVAVHPVTQDTPLMRAAAHNDTDVAAFLIDAGANVSAAVGVRKNTALHVAAIHDSADVARQLLDAGANVNARNLENRTPKMLAEVMESRAVLDVLNEK